MANVFVVLNPAAGNARPERVYRALARHLPRGCYEIYETTGLEDLPGLVAQRRAEGLDTFVAVGGDGTVGRVAAGLVGSDARLAILPAGTANALAHDAGIPERIEDALALVVDDAPTIRLDAMRVGHAYSFLNLSVGTTVGILRDAHQESKRKLGRLAYIGSALENLSSVRPQTVHLSVDGTRHTLRTSDVLVTNCPTLGLSELSLGGEVQMDDGCIEVVAFRARRLVDYVGVAMDLVSPRPKRRRSIVMLRAHREITIETDSPTEVQMDGDLVGRTPITVHIIPGAVRLISPRGRRETLCQLR